MTYYDEQLRTLQEQMARQKQLEAVRQELRGQCGALSARVRELESVMRDEQADVDRLEGRSLAALFFQMTGRIDERLDRERAEAYAARVRYDAVAGELSAAEKELRRCEAELSELRGCECRYEAVLREKLAAVKAAGGAAAEEILRLEEQAARLESQQKELGEAISAGCGALAAADSVLDSLDSAEGWGTWDLLGGGLIADLAKHSRLDEAQGQIEALQSQLRRFQTELADVRICADMQISVEGFLRFADYFFDGLFADWAVLDRINRSQSQVQETRSQVEEALSQLRAMADTMEKKHAELQRELDARVRSAPL